MRLFSLALLTTILSFSAPAQSLAPSGGGMANEATTLKVGDTAPDFTLPSTTGDKVTLSSFRGKQPVVLAFFPAAFTGGCTKEMQTYQLGIDKFKGSGAAVFGISEDNTPSQKVFANQLGLQFPLLSDFATRHVAQEYGVFLPQYGMAKRVTFVVDKEGKISYIEQGQDAVKIVGAGDACSRLAHKNAGTK